jgi:predicted  nucleic acid-binding Zn-ribbon protein
MKGLRRFRFRPLVLRCRKCDHRWKPAKMGMRTRCPLCAEARIELKAAEATAEAEEELEDADDGELIDARGWTDAKGRMMQATLRTVMKNGAGYFVGFFVREDGVGFEYPIGNLAAEDVDLVRRTMVEKDLYDPHDVA